MFSKQQITTRAGFKEFESSHIDKLKKVMSLKKETFFEQTNCLEMASSVVFFLTGESVFLSHKNISLIPTDEFLLKKETNYAHRLIKDLFTQLTTPEHSVFYIEFGGNAHALVIEKESNKGKTQYRVYQSWISKFTLLGWLEGRGKHPYTSTELIDFIHNTIKQISKESNRSGWCDFFCCSKKKMIKPVGVMKFKFNTHALEKNYDRVTANEAEASAKDEVELSGLK